MSESDPLRELVMETRRIDRQRLADLLRGRAWLDLEARTVVLDVSVRQKATVSRRIAVALLARKALSLLLDDEQEPDGLTPRELETLTGAKGGSIRPALKQLAEEGAIRKVGERYTVPAHGLDLIDNLLRED
jgi:hypothetical protein